MKLGLIFTNDWELFGDGSGDYFEIQGKPLENLIQLSVDYNAKFTVMAEVMQQFAHKELASKHQFAKDISEHWEAVLKKTVKHGNDVQLHIHPQWIGAEYQKAKWQLKMDNWATSSVEPIKLNEIISSGKNYLNELLTPINPKYNCNCFRAGAYCIQPEVNVVKALKNNQFIADTSVTKGMVSDGFYDFSNAENYTVPWFTKSDSVCLKGSANEGLLEMPIYAESQLDSLVLRKYLPSVYYKLKYGIVPDDTELQWQIDKDKIKNKRYPKSARFYRNKPKSVAFYLNAILANRVTQLDYDYLPPSVFVNMLEKIFSIKELKKYRDEDITIPVIASGHLKDTHNLDNIQMIFEKINKQIGSKVEYMNLSEAAIAWQSKQKQSFELH